MKDRGSVMEFENILKLVNAVSDSSLGSFEYEADGVKIAIQADRGPKINVQPDMIGSEGPAAVFLTGKSPQSEAVPEGIVVSSPLVGTFYAAPAEDAQAFVQVGDVVKEGQTLAIVEAMKLMNEIESEASGTVAEILVQNGEAVEYGQPLFRIV